jgi:hypothetical protein
MCGLQIYAGPANITSVSHVNTDQATGYIKPRGQVILG